MVASGIGQTETALSVRSGLEHLTPTLFLTSIHSSAWKKTLRTSPLRSSRKSALEIALMLYHRLDRPSGGYRVAVEMHDLPGALLGP
jgi:hypothetical protein